MTRPKIKYNMVVTKKFVSFIPKWDTKVYIPEEQRPECINIPIELWDKIKEFILGDIGHLE